MKSKVGLCNFAPHHVDSKKWLQQVEDGRLVFRQENVGKGKTKVAAKSQELCCSGWMVTAADLKTIVSSMQAMSSFIAKDAHQSELWKLLTNIQKAIWHNRQAD
jgi:hypothetical protein